MKRLLKSPWFWAGTLLVLAVLAVVALELGPSMFHDTYQVFQ